MDGTLFGPIGFPLRPRPHRKDDRAKQGANDNDCVVFLVVRAVPPMYHGSGPVRLSSWGRRARCYRHSRQAVGSTVGDPRTTYGSMFHPLAHVIHDTYDRAVRKQRAVQPCLHQPDRARGLVTSRHSPHPTRVHHHPPQPQLGGHRNGTCTFNAACSGLGVGTCSPTCFAIYKCAKSRDSHVPPKTPEHVEPVAKRASCIDKQPFVCKVTSSGTEVDK